MKKIIVLFLFLALGIKSQTKEFDFKVYWDTIAPVKKAMFSPYVKLKHWEDKSYTAWKAKNQTQFIKEFWYFAESFYVKRNIFEKGLTLNEEIIDISRYEHLRKENEEFELHIPVFKDVIVLLPKNKLLYNFN